MAEFVFNDKKLKEDAIYRLFRVRKTVNEMLHDRGYNLIDEELQLTQEEFMDRFNGKRNPDLTILVKRTRLTDDGDDDTIMVFFPVGHSDRSEKGRILQNLEASRVPRAIVVLQLNLSSHSQRVRRFLIHCVTPLQKIMLWCENRTEQTGKLHAIDYFLEAELLVNIMRHSLVPPHKVLDDSEKATLLRRYKLREGQLPRMQKEDPVARYFGLTRGQVVRIIRTSETAGRYITYRYVC